MNPKRQESFVNTSPRFGDDGTATRTKLYLLGKPSTCDISYSKIPKSSTVLRVFFHYLISDPNNNKHSNNLTLATKKAVRDSAMTTVNDIKKVWCHHFGITLILGKEFEGGQINPKKIMINTENTICTKIEKLYDEWKGLERLSRRNDRKDLLMKKEEMFKVKLDIPFNILQKEGEEILCNSGIKDWQEELQYLRQQLSPSQEGKQLKFHTF